MTSYYCCSWCNQAKASVKRTYSDGTSSRGGVCNDCWNETTERARTSGPHQCLTITADDIAAGVAGSFDSCPAVLAGKRLMGNLGRSVFLVMTQELARWIERFDNFGTAGVEPMEFDLVECQKHEPMKDRSIIATFARCGEAKVSQV